MAHFIGTVKGNRGEASRIGHKKNGLTTHCNGWHCGVSVYAFHEEQTGKDLFVVYKTGGSSNSTGKEIARVVEA